MRRISQVLGQMDREARDTPASLAGADRLAEDLRVFFKEREAPITLDAILGFAAGLVFLHTVLQGAVETFILPFDSLEQIEDYMRAMLHGATVLRSGTTVVVPA